MIAMTCLDDPKELETIGGACPETRRRRQCHLPMAIPALHKRARRAYGRRKYQPMEVSRAVGNAITCSAVSASSKSMTAIQAATTWNFRMPESTRPCQMRQILDRFDRKTYN